MQEKRKKCTLDLVGSRR